MCPKPFAIFEKTRLFAIFVCPQKTKDRQTCSAPILRHRVMFVFYCHFFKGSHEHLFNSWTSPTANKFVNYKSPHNHHICCIIFDSMKKTYIPTFDSLLPDESLHSLLLQLVSLVSHCCSPVKNLTTLLHHGGMKSTVVLQQLHPLQYFIGCHLSSCPLCIVAAVKLQNLTTLCGKWH